MQDATPGLRPRKQPRQERSRQTHEAILEAAARVFAEHGYAAGTTNRIAQDAGISIGTLYQHFPNKDAILVALMRRHVDQGVTLLQEQLASDLPEGLEDRLRLFIGVAVDNHREEGRLHQVLFEESPRPRPLLDQLHQLEHAFVGVVATMLEADPRVTVPDPTLAAWLTVACAESLVHRAAAATPRRDTADFVEEVVVMLTVYLTADRGTTGH